jgi:aldose 1-epimerase
MAFEVREARGTAGDRGGEVYELVGDRVRAEVWPQWGFNSLTWQVRGDDAHWRDVLFHMPDWEANPVPTRSGQPILFPFPGRLRDGRFTFEGKTYQLPLTDNTGRHAIHGFTPRNRWRAVDSSGGADCASLAGEFCLSKDLPEMLDCWPSDFNLRVTYKLFAEKVRVEARVQNVGSGRLPFGLGFHGYFQLPDANDTDIGNYVLQANVTERWETEHNLPTGRKKELPAELDFRAPRPIGSTAIDTVFTGLTAPAAGGGLFELARLEHPNSGSRVRVLADGSFRDLVLFTPVHRQAIAIEPYTCSADAANLWSRGIDCGWRVLEVGGEWAGAVEYRLEPVGV